MEEGTIAYLSKICVPALHEQVHQHMPGACHVRVQRRSTFAMCCNVCICMSQPHTLRSTQHKNAVTPGCARQFMVNNSVTSLYEASCKAAQYQQSSDKMEKEPPRPAMCIYKGKNQQKG